MIARSERPVRVAFFCDSLEPSGVGRVMETLAHHLPQLGYELYLVVVEDEGAHGLWNRMAPFVVGGARLTLREAHHHQARARFLELLREWRIDVFHNHIGATWEGHFGTLAARAAGVPCAVSTEHLPNVVKRDWELREKREISAHLDAVFAVSNSVRDSFLRDDLVSPDKIWTIENGVESPQFEGGRENARREVRREFGLSQDAPLFLFCGRLVEQKDPYALLDSFAQLKRSDAHLLVAGDGWLRGLCEERAQNNGIAKRVHFLGERCDIARLLLASDCFVLPSKFEGLPLAALEAMAARLPVVGCNCDGVRDCVTHEESGFLTAPADVFALAEGMERALGDEGKRWGERGYARFCHEFSAQHMAARHDAAYRKAWQGRGATTTELNQTPREIAPDEPKKIVWVFGWLVVGGEETELRLLLRQLDPRKFRIEVVACLRAQGMTEQTHAQLEDLQIEVDRTAYDLPFEDTVKFLSYRLQNADILITSQNVRDVFPALERIKARGQVVPPLIEHGGLVEEARGDKRFTSRYIGVCHSIQQEAARHMKQREHHALMLPSMVDVDEFSPSQREAVRREFSWNENEFVVGWVGRLDRKKRVEDFVRAAAIVSQTRPDARFVIVGGPDAFMPEYERELHALAHELGLDEVLRFSGDRADVPLLLSGLDALCFLSRGEGMPHIIAEAGAARLPVVATRDNGTLQQIEDGVSGVFVSHEAPEEVAAQLTRLMDEPQLCARLGLALREKVEREFCAKTVAKKWEAVFDEVLEERAEG